MTYVAYDDTAIWGTGPTPEEALAEVASEAGIGSPGPKCKTGIATGALRDHFEGGGAGDIAFYTCSGCGRVALAEEDECEKTCGDCN